MRMSGWIKVEKELETDPRTQRMAKAIAKLFMFMPAGAAEDPCNAIALPGVTLVCGALSRLWIFADSHIRADNTLDMSAAEIDEWLGIPGFCALIPPDWLIPVDDKSVELPGFLEHNGVEAKKRALTQKRVENHRIRTAVTECNALALPDQTRPDQTKTIEEGADVPRETALRASRSRATRLPDDFSLTAERAAYAVQQKVDPQRTFENFRDYWTAASGAKARKCDWDATWRMWCRREQSAPPTGGNVNRFQQPSRNNDAAWDEAKARAKAIGFRQPYPQESASVYATEVKQAENSKPVVPLAERRGLAGLKRIGAT
jgi:hypothetical protein